MKRPDVSERNRINNPMANPVTIEKMRLSKMGIKPSVATRKLMSEAHKKYLAEHPEEKTRLARDVWDKYTSKIAGTSWRNVSLRIRERDNHTCKNCGQLGVLVHHLDWHGKRDKVSHRLMNNNPNNLITLCHKCHNQIHRHKASDYYEKRSKIQSGISP